VIKNYAPNIVINCIGAIKQKNISDDKMIYVNSVFPHVVARCSNQYGARVLHFSTDCVFSGRTSTFYDESSLSDANDVYGKSKFVGELHDMHNLTIRTSIIGHELNSRVSLVDWFLSQQQAHGYTSAMFSGLPTITIANTILKYVIPNINNLTGVYHISSDPICKFDLLHIIKTQYNKNIEILPSDDVKINRTLGYHKFANATRYLPLTWHTMIHDMHEDYLINKDKYICF
jgi:dTDP-4-dehydrorhamnose reductase